MLNNYYSYFQNKKMEHTLKNFTTTELKNIRKNKNIL